MFRSLLIVASPYETCACHVEFGMLFLAVPCEHDMCECDFDIWYGVAVISRLLTCVGLFCKRALSKRRYSAKETYNFKEPTNCSHPIRDNWMAM